MFDFLFEPIMRILPKIPEVIFTLLVGYLIIALILWLLDHFLRIAKLPKLKGITLSIVKTALWLILIIYVANLLGFTRLVIAISGTALVLVFFLNNAIGPLVMDLASGVFLCGDPDFKPGSRIRFGKKDEETEGRILEVDMRKVRLVDDEGNTHVIPNAVMDREQWVVLEKPESRLKAKTQLAKEVIKNKIKKNK